MTGKDSACMAAAVFKLSDFYDRYSPHAYIDYSRVYVRHPKPKREYTLPEGYLELLEQKRYSPSTIKTYRAYFSDFMEYHKGRNIDRLKAGERRETAILRRHYTGQGVQDTAGSVEPERDKAHP